MGSVPHSDFVDDDAIIVMIVRMNTFVIATMMMIPIARGRR